jgi:4-amino-4-deoxy-L-arabinose transferase-like glycosyltransferase
MLLPLPARHETSSQTLDPGVEEDVRAKVSDSLRAPQGKMARWFLVLILVLYVLLAVGYSLGTPPWEAPDEPSHYLYSEYLAAHGSLPPEAPPLRGNYWEDGFVTSLYEWFQPPLYYALIAPQIGLANLLRPGTIPQAFPPVDPAFPEQVRKLFASLPDPSFEAPGLRLVRFFSVALGLCTLVVVYRMAMLASGGEQAAALMATGMMAFIPQYTFLSGYVTSDNLALLLSALCLLVFLHLLSPADGRVLRLVAGAGVLLALAFYTKFTLLFLLPLGLFCLLLRLAHHGSVGQWLLESSVLVGVAVVPFVLGLLILPGMRDQLAYAYRYLQVKPALISVAYLVGLWPETYTSFWGTFGWMNVSTPRWIANALTVITAAGLFGSLILLARGTRRPAMPSLRPSLLLLWTACGLVAIGFIRFNLSMRQPQGRFLFAALPALVILVALGYRFLAGRRFAVVGVSIVLLTLIANLVSLFGSLLPAYAAPF